MRIVWNPKYSEFEAEFTDFRPDQAAAKKAGFRTAGPPDWVWRTSKANPLTKLRKTRPESGLTITPDALLNYNRLKAQEDQNAAILAQLKAEKAAQKADSVEEETDGEFVYEKFDQNEASLYVRYIPPLPPTTLCHVCQTPVYFYECQSPPTCLDCEFDAGL